jgi:predicted 3-demethylubiquinone-9 3-methyltransferase (glyoxalase superfamily)
MQKLTPFLWFDNQAEEAAKFYVSIFKKSKVGKITRYSEAGAKVSGRAKGTAMIVSFRIEGQDFTALNGGPHFTFTEAISFVVNCRTQKEVDHYWEALSKGGDVNAQQCGWLKDKYGVSWQIVPEAVGKMLGDRDPAKAGRVMQAILQMKKIIIADLKRAYESA